MTTQPEALRLTQVAPYLEGGEKSQWIMSAIRELRRLHEANQELLAALKEVYTTCDWHGDDGQKAMITASAAIAKAERT